MVLRSMNIHGDFILQSGMGKLQPLSILSWDVAAPKSDSRSLPSTVANKSAETYCLRNLDSLRFFSHFKQQSTRSSARNPCRDSTFRQSQGSSQVHPHRHKPTMKNDARLIEKAPRNISQLSNRYVAFALLLLRYVVVIFVRFDRLVNATAKKGKFERLVVLLPAQPKLLEVHFIMFPCLDIFYLYR
jgi:hypothetical protein